jgi:hypothetical protein
MHNADVQQTGYRLIALENKTERNLTLSYVIQFFFLIKLVLLGPSPELPQLFVNKVMNLWTFEHKSHRPLNKKVYA